MAAAAFVVVAAMTVLASVSPAAAATDRPARAHLGYGADHPLAQSGWRAFARSLAEQKSAPKLSLFLNGPPPDDVQAIDNLGRGDYAFGAAALPAFAEMFPYSALISELGLAGGEDELAAAAAATEILTIDCPGCRRAFAAKRVVLLGSYGAARYVLLSRSRANTIQSFRGLSALTPGSAWDRLIGRLGGSVREEYADAGDLFAKGEIGAAIATPMELSDPDVWSHARHALIAPLGAYRGGAAFLASAGYWRRLDVAARRAVLNAVADGMVGVVWGYQNMADAALRAASARGLTIDAATPELDEAMRRAIAEDSRLVAETAGARFGVHDAAAFLDRFLFLYDKFALLLAGAVDARGAAAVLRQEIFDRIDVKTYGIGEDG